jgi:hypothetical protein
MAKIKISHEMQEAGAWALADANDDLFGPISLDYLGHLAAVAYAAMARLDPSRNNEALTNDQLAGAQGA